MEQNEELVSKSFVEGLKDFGSYQGLCNLPAKTQTGEAFNIEGVSFSKCFALFSKKLKERFVGMSSSEVFNAIIDKPQDFQFVQKPGQLWNGGPYKGQPIWSLTTSGNKLQKVSNAETDAAIRQKLAALLG